MTTNSHHLSQRLALLALGLAAGCGSGPAATTDMAVQHDLSSAPDLTVGQTIQVTFGIAADKAGTKPIPMATICIYPALTQCLTTDNTGAAIMAGVPANSEVAFSVVATSYQSLLLLYTTATQPIVTSHFMLTTAAIQLQAAALNVTLDPTKGILNLSTGSTGGITATLTGQTATGPFYADDMGILNKTDMSTTGSGQAVFVNATTGMGQVVFMGGTCAPTIESWAGPMAHTLSILSVANYITNSNVSCPQTP